MLRFSGTGKSTESIDNESVDFAEFIPHTRDMNNFETIILNADLNRAAVNSKGQFVLLAHVDAPGYLSVEDFEGLAKAGRITIHETGGNDIATLYGRVSVAYTINN